MITEPCPLCGGTVGDRARSCSCDPTERAIAESFRERDKRIAELIEERDRAIEKVDDWKLVAIAATVVAAGYSVMMIFMA